MAIKVPTSIELSDRFANRSLQELGDYFKDPQNCDLKTHVRVVQCDGINIYDENNFCTWSARCNVVVRNNVVERVVSITYGDLPKNWWKLNLEDAPATLLQG